MKFLLIKPRADKRSINLQSFMMCEPLELEYVAAYLEKLGHSADIADLNIDKNFKRAFKKDKYDVVAFTAYLIHVGIVRQYAETAKKLNPKIITLVGGVQAEVVPESFECDYIDVVLTGGMYAIKRVVEGIENGLRARELRALGRTPKGEIFDFPFPDRSKTAAYRNHYNYIYHDNCATIKTSFSCPYSCEFCFCARVEKYKERDLTEVIQELKTIAENNIFIVDDNFLFKRERIIDFCRLLDESDIHKTFIAFGRADFISQNEDMIKLLAQHGFDAFFVGIESYKSGELNDYNKRTSVEINNKAVRILERNGVQCYSGLIVGYDWTKKDFDNLIDYLNTFQHPMVNIQPITPMPGTPYYEKHRHEIIEDENRFERFDMAHAVMKPQNMSLRAFYYNILRAYFKTSASAKGRKYIRSRYGKKVYRRVRKGAFTIAMQYIRLIIKPR